MMSISILIVALPVACLFAAAWPLFRLRRFRPAVLGFSGTGCVGLSMSVFGLIAGAYAEDKPPIVYSSPELAEAVASGELEIKSDGSVEIPPGRPPWIGKEPVLTGKVHTVPVASGPYALDAQARGALDEQLAKATNKYIAEQLGSDLAPKLLGYNTRTIKKRFVKPENTYHDVARYSVGWMHENFALLEFDAKFRDELDRRWTKVRATSRLAQTGLFSGAALLLVGSLFGYFRLDNATRGYYTSRLQFMTAAAILSVVGLGAVVAQWIHWL